MVNFFNISPYIFINFSFLQGGLTTPDCNEAVLWTNLKATQTISEAQLEIFRSMTDSDGVTLNNNYRPPQPLNARTIYTTGVSKLLCSNDAPFDAAAWPVPDVLPGGQSEKAQSLGPRQTVWLHS